MKVRNVDLKSYLPPFLLEYKELDKLLDAEQPEFQTLVSECEKLLNNFFIDTADADGIARFEKVTGILPSTGDTLEMRRNRLFVRWNDITPYTVKTLWNKIVGIQGNDNIEIEVSTSAYEITITTHMEKRGQVDDLAYLLKVIMPCNLKIISNNHLEGQSKGTVRQAAGLGMTNVMFLTNDLTGNYQASAPANAAVGSVQTNTLFLTNDLNQTLTINGNLYGSNGMSETENINLNT